MNALLITIGDNGRGFFKYKGQYSYFKVDDRGRVWYSDKYIRKLIYTHNKAPWNNFSDGNTLECLIRHLSKYISNGTKLNRSFGPWAENHCDGDLWGYGDSMNRVRRLAMFHEIIPYNQEINEIDLEIEKSMREKNVKKQ